MSIQGIMYFCSAQILRQLSVVFIPEVLLLLRVFFYGVRRLLASWSRTIHHFVWQRLICTLLTNSFTILATRKWLIVNYAVLSFSVFERLVSFFDGCLDFPLDVNEYFPIGKTHFSNLVHSLCVYRIRFACQSPAECITLYIKQTGCIILLKKANHSFCFLGGFVFAFSGLN